MTATHQTDATATAVRAEHGRPPRRLSTETKSAFKTTEFVIYVVAVLGVLLVKHTRATGSRAARNSLARSPSIATPPRTVTRPLKRLAQAQRSAALPQTAGKRGNG